MNVMVSWSKGFENSKYTFFECCAGIVDKLSIFLKLGKSSFLLIANKIGNFQDGQKQITIE